MQPSACWVTRFLGTTDLSKRYPSLGLHPDTARYCWVKDPRAITVWHGNGPPSAAWLAFQEERRATGQRVPPYRQCLGVPLGLKLAPAFACALSGEMVRYLTVVLKLARTAPTTATIAQQTPRPDGAGHGHTSGNLVLNGRRAVLFPSLRLPGCVEGNFRVHYNCIPQY